MTNESQKEEKSRYRKTAQIVLPLMLGACCFYYILTAFQWAEIRQALQKVEITLFLAGSIIATLIFWFLRAVRWAILLRGENLKIPFFRLYLYTATAVGFANFTPFQSGEAFKVELFRKYGGERFSGYNYFFLEKLFDLATIATLAFVGIFVLFEFDRGNRIQLAIAALGGGLLILTAGLIVVLRKFGQTGRVITPDYKKLCAALFITTALWAIMVFGWLLIFQSAAISLTILQTAAVVSLTTIIGIISFIPGAVGVSEISIAAMLSQLGYAETAAQTGAIMIALYSLMILFLAFFHLIILKIVNAEKSKKLK